ncbi:MAG: hypothetical protein JWN33_638 [Candidatus Saccharibacteria bacterium]|nr:hypothetical protein [Candidatus Saccharibacteria bacterium]
MADLSEKILGRVERKFNKGDNLFFARSLLARFALASSAGFLAEKMDEKNDESNRQIARRLADMGANAVIYAHRTPNGIESSDSQDFVIITARGGIETKLQLPATGIVQRVNTSDIEG